jgi:hypothetical protein
MVVGFFLIVPKYLESSLCLQAFASGNLCIPVPSPQVKIGVLAFLREILFYFSISQ